MSNFEKKFFEYKIRLNNTQDSKEIEIIRTDIFSKNGFINSQFKKLGSLSEDEKKIFASNINKAKQELLEIFRLKALEVSDKDLNEKQQHKTCFGELMIVIHRTPCGHSWSLLAVLTPIYHSRSEFT